MESYSLTARNRNDAHIPFFQNLQPKIMFSNLARIASRPLLQKRALQILKPSSLLSPLARFTSIRSYSEGPAPLTMPGIEARVLQLLRDFEKVSKEKVTVDAHFINDLGLDSLDQVEITMGLEVGEVWLIDVRTSSILS
jgi:hypothetical protein